MVRSSSIVFHWYAYSEKESQHINQNIYPCQMQKKDWYYFWCMVIVV